MLSGMTDAAAVKGVRPGRDGVAVGGDVGVGTCVDVGSGSAVVIGVGVGTGSVIGVCWLGTTTGVAVGLGMAVSAGAAAGRGWLSGPVFSVRQAQLAWVHLSRPASAWSPVPRPQY